MSAKSTENRNYAVIVAYSPSETCWFARFPDLPGCMADGPTPTAAIEEAEAAKLAWIQSAERSGHSIPVITVDADEEYSGKFVLRLPKSLHRALAEQAQTEGTSLNQLAVAFLSAAIARNETACAATKQLAVVVKNAIDSIARLAVVQSLESFSTPALVHKMSTPTQHFTAALLGRRRTQHSEESDFDITRTSQSVPGPLNA